ncbi:MAG: hypothetical protein ACTSQO_06770 [Candidatus Helarchaeota archaeon]
MCLIEKSNKKAGKKSKFNKNIIKKYLLLIIIFYILNGYIYLINNVNAFDKFSYELENNYTELDKPDFAITNDYIVALNSYIYQNYSFYVINKITRKLERVDTLEVFGEQFQPLLVAGNNDLNYTQNLVVMVNEWGDLLLVDLNLNKIIKSTNSIYSNIDYEIKGLKYYKQYIILIAKIPSSSSYFLAILNDDLSLIYNFYLEDSSKYLLQNLKICENFLLTIFTPKGNENIEDELFIYNLTQLDVPPTKIVLGINIYDSAISKYYNLIYIGTKGSIIFLDLKAYSVVDSYNLSIIQSLTNIGNLKVYNNQIVLSFVFDSKIYFFNIINRTSINYKGYISGLELANQLEFEFLEQLSNKSTRMVINTYTSLLIIKFNQDIMDPSVYEKYGINIQESMPIILLILGISVVVLFVQHKKQK